MSTTNTDYAWYYYIRKKGRKYYLGLVDENGDDPTGAYTIKTYYDQIPDEFTTDDDTFTIPVEYEYGIIKAVAAELMPMMSQDYDKSLRREFQGEYIETIHNAVHNQIREAQAPIIQKPFDLRDDDSWTKRD